MSLPGSMRSAEANIMHVVTRSDRQPRTSASFGNWEVAMPRDASGKIPGAAHLDFEAWKDLIRRMGGRFNPEGVEPNAFAGCVRPLTVCGFTAAEGGSNAHRVERTHRDVRLDGADHYFTMFQVAGQSAMTHNEETERLDVGDVVIVDMARPATFFNSNAGESWKSVALLLPRQSLVSHLGFEPRVVITAVMERP